MTVEAPQSVAELELSSQRARDAVAADANVAAVIAIVERLDRQFVAGDKEAFADGLTRDIVVNNPGNMVVGYDQVVGFFERGLIDYAHFKKNIDYAGSYGPDHVLLMGAEIFRPKGVANNVGKTVHRRFTDLWRRDGDTWRCAIRQATIYKVE